MPDHPALVPRTTVGARRDQHVPALTVWIPQHPRVPPVLVVPARRPAHRLVPPRIGSHQRVSRVLHPEVQVVGGGEPDLLQLLPLVRQHHARVEHVPAPVVALHDRTRPCGGLIEAGRAIAHHRVRDPFPMDEVRGDGVPDTRASVPPDRVMEGAGGIQEEDVIGLLVLGEPEIPHPRIRQSKHQRFTAAAFVIANGGAHRIIVMASRSNPSIT